MDGLNRKVEDKEPGGIDPVQNETSLPEKSGDFETRRVAGGNPSEEGFNVYVEFIEKMHEKYPDHDYPYSESLKKIEGVKLVAYVSLDSKGETVGVLNGEKNDRKLTMSWFIIDPECKNTNVAKELWNMAFADFDKIQLNAEVFGLERGLTDEQRASRQNALVRYYKRLGFKPDKDAPFYEHPYNPLKPMPMIWEKEK